MKRKINLRLGLIALIGIAAAVTGVTLVFYSLFQQQVREDLKQNAHLLVETGVFQEAHSKGLDTKKIIERFSSGNLRITWIDKDGTVLFDNDTDVSELSNHLDRPEIQQALKRGEGESIRHSDTMNLDTFYYAALLEDDTILRVSMQARTIANVLVTAIPVILLICVLVLLSCILIGHLLTKQIMKPLENMADNLDSNHVTCIYEELEPFAERIRIQHEKVLLAAKSRQDFTANISHELKTPITAISGYAELIEHQMVDQESEVHIAKQIRHNAERLLSLVTDIIRLSELDHSELSRNFEQMDLFSAAKECAEDLRPLAEQKQISLTCEGVFADIYADRALIRELIDNLIQNGIQYNEKGGSIQVHVSVEEGRPILSVKDDGIGIPADQLDRVFERFYRVDKSRSRETGGTGLGLAIVKHIAELHQAEIMIRSSVGEGTEIKIRF